MLKAEQDDEVANFLMMIIDQEKELKENCQITPSEALNLIQPLHAMIDEDIKNGPHIITTDLEASCIANCHCGIYSDLANSIKMKNSLYDKAQKIPRKNLIICAEKTSQWFCSSKLFNRLKSEAQSLNANETNGL